MATPPTSRLPENGDEALTIPLADAGKEGEEALTAPVAGADKEGDAKTTRLSSASGPVWSSATGSARRSGMSEASGPLSGQVSRSGAGSASGSLPKSPYRKLGGGRSGSVSRPVSGSLSGSASGPVSGSFPASSSRGDSGSASGSVSGSVSGSLSGDLTSEEAIAARRAAHGLSPETTNEAEASQKKSREESAKERQKRFKHERRVKIVRITIIGVVVAVLAVVCIGFWLIRWGLHDDPSSIQGQWRVQGSDAVIAITDEKIVLTDEVSYGYAMDPSAKTLAFTFGGMSGTGRYRFSLDHDRLSISDGEYDWFGTLVEDVPWTAEALGKLLTGDAPKSPELEEGGMVLERVG